MEREEGVWKGRGGVGEEGGGACKYVVSDGREMVKCLVSSE